MALSFGVIYSMIVSHDNYGYSCCSFCVYVSYNGSGVSVFVYMLILYFEQRFYRFIALSYFEYSEIKLSNSIRYECMQMFLSMTSSR